MTILRQIWTDIRNGENIDLYASILIAFVVVVLGLLNLSGLITGLIPSLTLVMLGLLAISNLVNRRRVEELSKSMTQSAKVVFLEEFPPSFKDDLTNAKELWLVGVTLRKVITKYYVVLDEKIRKGYKIRALLVHPEGAAIALAATRYFAADGRNPERASSWIKDNLVTLSSLQEIAPERLEIRTIKNPLTFGAVCINPETESGVLYIEHFPFRVVPDSMPRFVLRASDGTWYDFFMKEIRELWDAGEDWK